MEREKQNETVKQIQKELWMAELINKIKKEDETRRYRKITA